MRCRLFPQRAACMALWTIVSLSWIPTSFAASAAQVKDAKRPSIAIVDLREVPVRGDITVLPQRTTLSVSPGEERKLTVLLTDRKGQPVTINFSMEDISAGSMSGEFLHFYGDRDGPFSARTWFSMPATTVRLNQGEAAIVPLTIRVPTNASPGDHYAAFVGGIEQGSAGTGSQVPSVPKGKKYGALFFITVKGGAVESGSLLGIHPVFPISTSSHVRLQLSARNAGNVLMQPTGSVIIRNLLGLSVGEAPVSDWMVLRNSSRTIDLAWSPSWAIGPYTAVASFKAYGRHLDTVTAHFWVLPILPLFIFVGIVAVFAVMFVLVLKEYKVTIQRRGKAKRKK